MRDLVGPPPCATRVRDYGAPQVSPASPRGSSSRLAGRWRRPSWRAIARLSLSRGPRRCSSSPVAPLVATRVVSSRLVFRLGLVSCHVARVASAALVVSPVVACTPDVCRARREIGAATPTLSGSVERRASAVRVPVRVVIVTLLIFFSLNSRV